MKFDIPFYSYTDIQERCETILNQYHPSFSLPIPIDKIIELKLKINVYPFPNLYRTHRLNGGLSGDRSIIWVDEYQYDTYYEKFRFTIAHELGHYFLHQELFEQLQFADIEKYIQWRMNLDPDDINWYEKHGDWFAENILVPTKQLYEICGKVVEKHRPMFQKMESVPDNAWSYIANEVAGHFQVSPPVVEIRIRREQIATKIEIE